MSVATGPYTLPGGGEVRIPPPTGTLVAKAVAVTNLTPGPVSVTVSGTSKIVPPGATDLFAISAGQAPIPVRSLGATTTGGQITATWFTPATMPTSGYPFSGSITKIATTGEITAKISGPVTIASGTVDLGAGSVVAVNAGQLTATTIPLQAVATQMLVTTFGTGATGTVTISANATLTHVGNYKNLTIDGGVTLTAPWIVFVTTTLILGGVIANNGGNAVSSTAGSGGLSGSFGGGGVGGNSTNPTAKAPPTADWEGGSGGSTYSGGIHAGVAGPPITAPILFSQVHNFTFSGGGGGAGDIGGGPCAGGGGAGVVMVAARIISGSGNITAIGGNGTRNGTYAGGGGGGGIALVYSHVAKTWTGKAIVTPGTTPTKPAGSGGGGSHVVRKKFVGAIFT